jgi:hypothetical protein
MKSSKCPNYRGARVAAAGPGEFACHWQLGSVLCTAPSRGRGLPAAAQVHLQAPAGAASESGSDRHVALQDSRPNRDSQAGATGQHGAGQLPAEPESARGPAT